jgi:zinc transport system substrate-binding protein
MERCYRHVTGKRHFQPKGVKTVPAANRVRSEKLEANAQEAPTVKRLILAAVAVFLVCGPYDAACKTLRIAAGVAPVAAWAQEIAGDRAVVASVLPRAEAPGQYTLPADRLKDLAANEALLMTGLPEERAWLAALRRITPDMKAIDLCGVVRTEVLSDAEPLPRAPYFWTSPKMAALIMKNIRAALAELDPAGAEDYERNHALLASRLQRAAKILTANVGQVAPRRTFLVSRPGLGWLARYLGLGMALVQPDGRRLHSAELKAVVQYAATMRFPIIFIQPDSNEADAFVVAEAIGAQLLTADPLARDWIKELESLSRSLPAALR